MHLVPPFFLPPVSVSEWEHRVNPPAHFAHLLAHLQLAGPPHTSCNAAWMLLLLNIIYISCFSTCSTHFSPLFNTRTHNTYGPVLSAWFCLFYYNFFPPPPPTIGYEMDTEARARVLGVCAGRLWWLWHKSLAGCECLFWDGTEVQRKLWAPYCCACRALCRPVPFDFLQQGDAGFAPSLTKWNV